MAPQQMLGHSASPHKEALEERKEGKTELLLTGKSGPWCVPGVTNLSSGKSRGVLAALGHPSSPLGSGRPNF